ncbi:outer membrane beta-barrel family protein [Prevotella cerevisiae]|uniref:Outer membrane beta-barrel family protein n=1 Tax=Segatella cerevisiae TaxID=2053716 RepID=A0ABT1BYI3_9BACT|nr:outer membrane beta-barrel protein [Segatella cerevisiae]MCO6026145.1 outer membrane beta-barrel family protein [Segatella cerevisiae]
MDKKAILLWITLGFTANVYAQQDSVMAKTQELSEVVIESKRIIHHNSYDSYVPSTQQKEHAANGLDLLHLIRLPRIRVDQVVMSVSSMGDGEVQIRINNVPSTVADLQALTPDRVLTVDYITSPGLKYGKGVSAVINIKTKKGDAGVASGLNTMNAVTTNYNDDSGWFKLTKKQSEFGVLYNFKLNSNEDVKTNGRQKFVSADNSVKNITRDGKYNDSRFVSNDVTLSYNVTNDKSRVFDMKLSTNWNRFPDRFLTENVSENGNSYEMTTFNKNNEKRPMLKLYYADAIGKNDTYSAYLTTAYVRSNYERSVETPVLKSPYDVKGDKYSILGEVDFTHSFEKAGELSAGYQQTGEFTKNQYHAAESLIASLHNDSQYLFAEYSGGFGKFGLTAGAGVCRDYFNGGSGKYTFWSFRPSMNASYNINDKMTLTYKYESETSVPSLAQLTSFSKLDDAYELVVGNPDLKPYNTDFNEIKLNYDLGKTYFSLVFDYDYSHDMICDAPVTLDNGIYKYSYWNEANRHHFNLSLYAEQYLFGKKLFIYAMPYMVRDIMTGGLRHTNTCWSVKTGSSVYLGKFNVDFDYDSSSEDLSGETLVHHFGSTTLSVGYKRKTLSVKCGVKNIFNSTGTGNRVDYLSDIASSRKEMHNHAFGNMVYLSLSWNISSGKRHAQKAVKSADANIDTGIIK